jgi:hypothetical protein
MTLKPEEEVTIAFDEVQAKYFRILFLSANPNGRGATVQLCELHLLPEAHEKLAPGKEPVWDRERAIELSKFTNADGRLEWDAPAGKWQINRIGYTLTYKKTAMPGSGPVGMEIDPMSAEAMDMHFAQTGAELIADAGPLAGKVLQYVHIDSSILCDDSAQAMPQITYRIRV